MFKIRLGMLAAVGAALLAFAPSANAGSIGTDTTYSFTGTCTDCAGTGTGTLVLTNYVNGTDITNDNFVSFDYSSNLFTMSLTSDNFGSISGILGSSPGSYLVDITSQPAFIFEDAFLFLHFHSDTSPGSWVVGIDSGIFGTGADFGPTSCWGADCAAAPAATPIPGAAMLFGSVFAGGAGFGAWRRRRKVPAA